MEKFDITVDLIRAMARRCEDLELVKSQRDMFKRGYEREQERNIKLVEKLKENGIDY